ncbi:MAG: hypothetical protein AAEJ46_05920 [Planctomycetota bacterium]|jgi:hypothetical protein
MSSRKTNGYGFLSVIVLAILISGWVSGCSITKSTRVHDEDGKVVESTSFRIGTPFGTLGAKDDEDDD